MMNRLKRWWRNLRRRSKISRVVVVESMTVIPAQIGSDLYLVRQGDFDKRAVLDCPCGCGRRIDLNLVCAQNPSWSAQLRRGSISLRPSIWLTDDACKSHFFVKQNKIEWVD
jgi:hypothetical protein